ncbi:LysR family transcriptional regulator [Brevibacterium moorei]|uniref:LysR family transcriptional regulator n=1 Tax=Brevibacterium moorei TaxID=2968457 RepID=UPI00211C298C|nr:LysR family transcriptional regulator [Brevibacterium sp. 68QC2CO]MCQ9386651.1 LysR family transcriptional regulator [Brevibacterium sp. 68QC2CO]
MNASEKPVVHPHIAPDDLLTLLTVARLGKYTAAAQRMGVNHTTISRRIAALEKAIGQRVLTAAAGGYELTGQGRELLPAAEAIEQALLRITSGTAQTGTGELVGTVRIAAPEAFVLHFAIPALAALQRQHPGLQLELNTVTRKARRYRTGMDIEVVVDKPQVSNSTLHPLRKYSLGLFASRDYLRQVGTPEALPDLAGHRIVYYPEHSLDVDALDGAVDSSPTTAGFVSSNSVEAQVRATIAGMGVGLLPVFMAGEHPGDSELVRVVPDFTRRISYWASIRPEALRSPLVTAVLGALKQQR